MNKKSSVPITLLVIGVFALCAFALLTFFMFEFKFNNSFVVVDFVRQANLQSEEFSYYLSKNIPEEKVLSYFPSVIKENGNYVLRSSFEDNKFNPSFSFRWIKKVLIFELKYYFK
jgi:hypothetical protein